MTADPSKMSNPIQVRQLLANPERLNAIEIAVARRLRLFELGGADLDDPIKRRLTQAVAALEKTYREKHGRAQAVGYTRQKIANAVAVATLSDWALNPSVPPRFPALVEEGMANFTGACIVAEFPDRFRPHMVAAARQRLKQHGVKLPLG